MNPVSHTLRFALRVAVAFCVWLAGARAVHAAGGLPVIRAHSKTDFAVYKGDTFTLEVKAKGEDLEYKWVQAKDTFCREKSCEIDSTNWGLGTHKISFVVFNAKGSLYLRYRIKVLAAPTGYAAGRVKPELEVVGEDIETVTSVDLAVKTLTGRGFSYHMKKLQVVGPTPRTLDWGEKLRTQDESTMQILREGKEQHILGPSTAVSLAKSESGHRVLVLDHGMLRSRQLDGKEPYWSIVFGSWLQVDTDGDGDVLVNRVREDTDQIELYVVRGNARVFRRRSSETLSDEAARVAKIYGVAGEAITVPQGGYVLLTRNFENPPRVEAPLAKPIGAMLATTTPLYLPGGDLRKEGPGTGVLSKQPEDFSEAVAIALDAANKRDYPAAVEALQPFEGRIKKDYRAALAYGMGLKGMLFDKPAAEYLLAAGRLRRSSPDPVFLLGEMELAARHWKKAMRFLDLAEDLGYRDTQALTYYKGVASYFMKEYTGARNELTKSLWEDGAAGVAASTDLFRRKVRFDGWLEIRSGLGMIYDDNVLRLHKATPATLPAGIKTTKSGGYEGHAGFSLWGYRGPIGEIGLSFDAKKIGWLEPTLVKVGSLDEELALNMAVNSKTPVDKDPDFTLGATPFAATKLFGSQRVADTIGARAHMDVPGLANLSVRGRTQTNLDPLPAQDDILDPTLGEVVAPSERSNHQTYYGLALTPLKTEAWSLGGSFDAGSTTMRSELRLDESFDEKLFGLAAGFEPSLRTSFDLGLGYTARRFPDAGDHRADKAMRVGFGWRYRYTTSLYHDVLVDYEKQKSNRDAATYHTLCVGYHLSFDL